MSRFRLRPNRRPLARDRPQPAVRRERPRRRGEVNCAQQGNSAISATPLPPLEAGSAPLRVRARWRAASDDFPLIKIGAAGAPAYGSRMGEFQVPPVSAWPTTTLRYFRRSAGPFSARAAGVALEGEADIPQLALVRYPSAEFPMPLSRLADLCARKLGSLRQNLMPSASEASHRVGSLAKSGKVQRLFSSSGTSAWRLSAIPAISATGTEVSFPETATSGGIQSRRCARGASLARFPLIIIGVAAARAYGRRHGNFLARSDAGDDGR